MPDFKVTEEDVDRSVLEVLISGMDDDTASKQAPLYKEAPLNILARDEAGRLIGGLLGKVIWDWLYVDTLWVAEELRGKSMGSDLMAKAEHEAKQRGCIGVWLWTQSFQAPGFYEKCGCVPFVVMPDFPKGHQRIGLRKIFSHSDEGKAA